MGTAQTRGVFGQPTDHSDNPDIDTAEALAGLAGEQATARLINPYSDQAMIFHGLRLPIKLRTDIDHLIVRDNAILAIDSKFWSVGTYWSFGGNLYRGLAKTVTPTAMTQAVNALAKMLSVPYRQCSVITVVHSKRNKARIAKSAFKLSQPVIGAPLAPTFIDQWVADHPGEPSQRLARKLLNIFRKGASR